MKGETERERGGEGDTAHEIYTNICFMYDIARYIQCVVKVIRHSQLIQRNVK
jgi:hypothetical protein